MHYLAHPHPLMGRMGPHLDIHHAVLTKGRFMDDHVDFQTFMREKGTR